MSEEFELQEGENFASLIFTMFRIPDRRLSSSFSDHPISIGQNCWVSSRMPFAIDNEWRKWLGRIISDRIENGPGKIVLTAKSQNPDESSEALLNRISLVFWGITIVSGIPDFSSGDQVHGHFQHDRSVQTGIKIGLGMRRLYPTYAPNSDLLTGSPILEIPESEFKQSVQFATRIESIHKNIEQEKKNRNIPDNRSLTDFFSRIVSGFLALQEGMSSIFLPERLHQYARAIESFLPATVIGNRDFSKYLVDLLIQDLNNQSTLQQIYNLRSAQEHHRPFDQRALPNETDPDSVAWRRTRQAEALARELFKKFISENQGFLNHFRNESSLELFWSNGEVTQAWGSPFDLQGIS